MWPSEPIGKRRRLYLVQTHKRFQWLLLLYRSHSPSYLRFLRTNDERDADPGTVAVRANAEGEKESTQVHTQMRHFPIEKGNTVMPSGRLPTPRSRPTGSRTVLKPADDKARLMMSFKAECRGKRPALSGRREDVGHICLLWLHNGICVGHRRGGPDVD